jgi:hypothetical protein
MFYLISINRKKIIVADEPVVNNILIQVIQKGEQRCARPNLWAWQLPNLNFALICFPTGSDTGGRKSNRSCTQNRGT